MYISHSNRFNEAAAVPKSAGFDSRLAKEKILRFRNKGAIPFLCIHYILNGKHEPQKIQWLNIALAAFFFAGGFFLDPDLFLVGFIFSGIAVINGLNQTIMNWLCPRMHGSIEDEIESHLKSFLGVQKGR